MQFLRFRVVLPKLRTCLLQRSEAYLKISENASRVPKRCYMHRVSEKFESKFRKQDDVPEGWELVYRGGMDKYIHLANWTTKITFVTSIYSLGKLFYDESVITFPIQIITDALIGIKNYTQLTIMYASFFAMVFSIQYVCNRYVIRMYYNAATKTYKAIRVGYLPLGTSSYDFPAHSLVRKPKKYLLPWRNVQYRSGKESLLIFDHGFKTNAHYDKMFIEGTEDIPNEYEDDNIPPYKH